MSKNVFVFAEQRDNHVQKVAYELVGEARRLADDLGESVVAVLIGEDVSSAAPTLIERGADEVIVVEDPILKEYATEPYTKAMYQIIMDREPEIFLLGATSIGRDLAPRVSARVHTGLTADCTSLEIDSETNLLRMTRPAFGGNIMATILCADHRPQMATVRPGVMQALKPDSTRTGKTGSLKVEFKPEDMNIKIKEVVKESHKRADITESNVLISGGRGIGKKENFQLLDNLAEVLGGLVSSSRANVDAGWIEKERQVGQTGKTVRPDLYIACGISGAIQHLAGMEEAEYIVAINKNKDAPIFSVADLGIVGDALVILPKLTEALKLQED